MYGAAVKSYAAESYAVESGPRLHLPTGKRGNDNVIYGGKRFTLNRRRHGTDGVEKSYWIYTVSRPVARGVRGSMKLTAVCAAGHFAPARSATKRKVVQTLAQCPPPVLFCLPICPQMRSRSCNFQKKSGSPARRVAPGPGFNRLKSKKSTCVPLKTLKLKVLWEEGTKLISIAKFHLEVLRAVKPNGLALLAHKRPRVARFASLAH